MKLNHGAICRMPRFKLQDLIFLDRTVITGVHGGKGRNQIGLCKNSCYRPTLIPHLALCDAVYAPFNAKELKNVNVFVTDQSLSR
jgi:hypothetical protein